MLGSATFAMFSLSIASLIKNRDRVMGFGQLMTMPLFFASSAIYPIALMPSWLQAMAAGQPAHLHGRCDPDADGLSPTSTCSSIAIDLRRRCRSLRWCTPLLIAARLLSTGRHQPTCIIGGRARRGTSGALYLQSAPAGLNPLPRPAFAEADGAIGVEDRVPRSGDA